MDRVKYATTFLPDWGKALPEDVEADEDLVESYVREIREIRYLSKLVTDFSHETFEVERESEFGCDAFVYGERGYDDLLHFAWGASRRSKILRKATVRLEKFGHYGGEIHVETERIHAVLEIYEDGTYERSVKCVHGGSEFDPDVYFFESREARPMTEDQRAFLAALTKISI